MSAVDQYGEFHAESDHRSAQVIQIESSKLLPSILLLAAISVAALIGSLVAWGKAAEARTEARMLEYYVNILNQTLNEQGVTTPDQNYMNFKKEHDNGER